MPTGTAFFGPSTTTNLTLGGNTTLEGWTFNEDALDYTFTTNNRSLTFDGQGIVVDGGSITITNTESGAVDFVSASAGAATIDNFGTVNFYDGGDAGNATITSDGGVGFAFVNFYAGSTAGTATITSETNSFVDFTGDSTAGASTITGDGGTIRFYDTSTLGQANIELTGSGSLEFHGGSTAGTATITGLGDGFNLISFNGNSTASTATITNGAFLEFRDNSTAADATIVNNYQLDFYDGSTAGNAEITNNSTAASSGRISFQGNSTAGNAAITNVDDSPSPLLDPIVDFSLSTGPGGDGKLSAGSIAGAGRFELGGNELTVGGNDRSTEVTGVISDCGQTGTECLDSGATGGSLIKVGAGTLTLSGVNTYTGGTTISAGTLQLGNGATSGSIIGNVLNNATLTFDRSDDYVFSGVISGSGAVNQIGGGTTIFSADNTYGGGTTILAGTLQLGNGGASGSIVGNVLNNSLLSFNRSDDVTFSGLISGTGAVGQSGGGATIFTANHTYTGLTTISAGTLQLGDGGTSGSVAGDILNNSILAFDRSDNFIMPGEISGTGAVEQNGTGTTAFTADNTYTGGTTINFGTLQLGNGGSTGSILGDVTNNSILAFNRSDDYVFEGVISGTGGVHQIGSGKTSLTADNSGLTGISQVFAGTLEVNNILGGIMRVEGGTLAGTGTVGNTSNFAGGTIAPGSDGIGTLTVDGDYYSFGGALQIEAVLGDDSSPTDLLVVGGNSALVGGTTQVFVTNLGGAGAETTGDGIRIVRVDGTSDAGVFALGAPAIAGAYSYGLFQNGIVDPTDGDWYLRAAGLAPTVPVYEAYPITLLGLTELPTLQQRVGDRYWPGAGSAGVDLPAADEPSAATKYGSSLWTRIEAAHGHIEGESTTGAAYDSNRYLLQVGFDGQFVETGSGMLIGGLNAQYGRADTDISSDTGDSDNSANSYGIGATLTWYGYDGFYVDGQAAIAYLSSDASADAVGEIVDDNEGVGYAFSIEAGRKIPVGDNWSFVPQAQLAYSSVDFDDFTDPFDADVSLDSANSLKGRIGMALGYDAGTGISRSHIYAIGNFTYEFLDGTSVDVAGVEVNFEPEAFGGELGIGGTYEWGSGKYALHGEALGHASFEGSYGIKGTVGFATRF